MIDLNQFCSKNESRQNLLKPFNYGDNEVAATNGYIAIIVHGRGVDSDIEPTFVKIINEVELCEKEEKYNFSEMKRVACEHEFDERPCPWCHGERFLTEDKFVEDYDGNTDWIELSCECPNCEEWDQKYCKKCDGLNFIYEKKFIEICGIKIKSDQAYLLKDIGEITFNAAKNNRMLLYKFNGGHGLIMKCFDK